MFKLLNKCTFNNNIKFDAHKNPREQEGEQNDVLNIGVKLIPSHY